jgi:enamine deaminase RidA (YjgF/YER057c/UK114 family)
MTERPTGLIRAIHPPELAAPPGYSNVVEVSGSRLVFIAGQTALDRDGNLVGGNNVEAQADQAFRNLGYALAAAGCTASDLVKLTVFVRDMAGLPLYRDRGGGGGGVMACPGRSAESGRHPEALAQRASKGGRPRGSLQLPFEGRATRGLLRVTA